MDWFTGLLIVIGVLGVGYLCVAVYAVKRLTRMIK